MKKIIDVSYHNGKIDWAKVKQSGEIFGAIIRCGYGDNITSQDDKQFTANVEGCLKNNIPFGVYIYSYATTKKQAESEASHALRLCEKYKDKMTFPVYYDLEEPGTEKGATERAYIFGKALTAKGYKVGIYANLNWWNNYLKGLDGYSKWVARYSNKLVTRYSNIKPVISGMDIWQYTDNGKVAGINGVVDLNFLYKDFDTSKGEENMTAEFEALKKENAELKKEIENNKDVTYYRFDEIPDWGKKTVRKLVDKGAILGTNKGLDITHTMLRGFVVNDRCGLYDLEKDPEK